MTSKTQETIDAMMKEVEERLCELNQLLKNEPKSIKLVLSSTESPSIKQPEAQPQQEVPKEIKSKIWTKASKVMGTIPGRYGYIQGSEDMYRDLRSQLSTLIAENAKLWKALEELFMDRHWGRNKTVGPLSEAWQQFKKDIK